MPFLTGGAQAPTTLNDLVDVAITSPDNNAALVWNSGTGLWEDRDQALPNSALEYLGFSGSRICNLSNTSGVSTKNLTLSTSTATATVFFSYFTCIQNITVSQIMMRAVASGVTPTWAAMGLYTVDASNNMTLVRSTGNDTTLFTATNTNYQRTFANGSITLAFGQRYAMAVTRVAASGTPTLQSSSLLSANDAQPYFAGSAVVALDTVSGFVFPASVSSSLITNTPVDSAMRGVLS